jgi:hypothetical protein
VTLVDRMRGDDSEDTALLVALVDAARAYLRAFEWCRAILEEYYGLGVGGVVGVFLFRIVPAPDVDEWLWVVVGDVPSCYLVTDRARDPIEAMKVYCELMDEWVRSVREGGREEDVFPVSAARTARNADSLERRIRFVREKVIPNFQ